MRKERKKPYSDISTANSFTRPGPGTSTPSSDLEKNNDNTLHNTPESAVNHQEKQTCFTFTNYPDSVEMVECGNSNCI